MNSLDISQLDFSQVNKWPRSLKVLFCVVFCMFIFVAGYWFDLGDLQEELDRVTQKQEALKSVYEKKQQLSVNLSAYEAQIKVIEADFGTLLKQLPASTEVPALVEDISQAAIKNGLTIQSIKLQAEHAEDFYIELPIEIIVVGRYHALGNFVSDVSAFSRIVTLHDFIIEKDPSSNFANDQLLEMKVTAKTYRYADMPANGKATDADKKTGKKS